MLFFIVVCLFRILYFICILSSYCCLLGVLNLMIIALMMCIVFGCADPPTSGSVWFNRDDVDSSEAKMGCRTTKETWRVSCVDNQWRGTPVNCSHCEHSYTYHRTSYTIALLAAGRGKGHLLPQNI